MQLLQNDAVKEHEIHHSGTWGDAEQKSGGVWRKKTDLIFLLNFKICLYTANNYHCGTGEMYNNNLQKTILFNFFFINFLKTKTFYKPISSVL